MNYPIFLIGFMASGKTSLGKKLAKKLQANFIDLDALVEQAEGSSINQIFASKGEDYFRSVEAGILKNISTTEKAVISVGGGTPCFMENMKYMNHFGTTVYLKKTPELLLGRLRQNKSGRPLVAKLSDQALKHFVNSTLEERSYFYEKADIIYENDARELSTLVEAIRDA